MNIKNYIYALLLCSSLRMCVMQGATIKEALKGTGFKINPILQEIAPKPISYQISALKSLLAIYPKMASYSRNKIDTRLVQLEQQEFISTTPELLIENLKKQIIKSKSSIDDMNNDFNPMSQTKVSTYVNNINEQIKTLQQYFDQINQLTSLEIKSITVIVFAPTNGIQDTPYRINNNQTLGDLKKQIKSNTNISPENQRLSHENFILYGDTARLYELDINDQAKIRLQSITSSK